jgi:hypothetical protein
MLFRAVLAAVAVAVLAAVAVAVLAAVAEVQVD